MERPMMLVVMKPISVIITSATMSPKPGTAKGR